MPTAAALDAQSNRSSPLAGWPGYDAGKKVKGRKRNLVVDTLGLILAVTVTAANIQDCDAAHGAADRAATKYPSLQTLFVDRGCAGQCAQAIRERHSLRVDAVGHTANKNGGRWCNAGQGQLFHVQANTKGFVILPKRWVVELPGTSTPVGSSCVTAGSLGFPRPGSGWSKPLCCCDTI